MLVVCARDYVWGLKEGLDGIHYFVHNLVHNMVQIFTAIAEFRKNLAQFIERVVSGKERFIISQHGKPKAVLLSYPEYLQLTGGLPKEGKKISLQDWLKEKPVREEFEEEIAKHFDAAKFARKGQKGYKARAVQKRKT